MLLSMVGNFSLDPKYARCIALRESLTKIFPNHMSSCIIDYVVLNFRIESVNDPRMHHIIET